MSFLSHRKFKGWSGSTWERIDYGNLLRTPKKGSDPYWYLSKRIDSQRKSLDKFNLYFWCFPTHYWHTLGNPGKTNPKQKSPKRPVLPWCFGPLSPAQPSVSTVVSRASEIVGAFGGPPSGPFRSPTLGFWPKRKESKASTANRSPPQSWNHKKSTKCWT